MQGCNEEGQTPLRIESGRGHQGQEGLLKVITKHAEEKKFADGTKLRRVADTPESCAAIRQDLNRLENWVERN